MRLYSDCCGAAPKAFGDYDSDSTDIGICPECGEHCTFEPDPDDLRDAKIDKETDEYFDRTIPEWGGE